jgi:hypothetical protein
LRKFISAIFVTIIALTGFASTTVPAFAAHAPAKPAATSMHRVRSLADAPPALRKAWHKSCGCFQLDLTADANYDWSRNNNDHAVIKYADNTYVDVFLTSRGYAMIQTHVTHQCYRSDDQIGGVTVRSAKCDSSKCADKWVWNTDTNNNTTFQDELCPTSLNLYAGINPGGPFNGQFINLVSPSTNGAHWRWIMVSVA